MPHSGRYEGTKNRQTREKTEKRAFAEGRKLTSEAGTEERLCFRAKMGGPKAGQTLRDNKAL